MSLPRNIRSSLLFGATCALACAPTALDPSPLPLPVPSPSIATTSTVTSSLPQTVSSAPTSSAPVAAAPTPACPEDMALVDTVHCPDTRYAKVGLRCQKRSRNEPNNLTLCHRFSPGQRCSVPKRRQRFCIDRFEFPNKRGAHPPVMVSAYDAAALCAEQGKRMCWESEWTAACEGPKKLPFPYGYSRSKKHCNIDNPYIHPSLKKAHDRRNRVRGPELLRLDQSVLSGSLESCKSGFGVYDLTGNFDEWVLTEYKRGKGKWAGLKGGAWGHVRNACRPITTSHVAHWSYYFISFRCCKAAGAGDSPAGASGAPLWIPPSAAPRKHPGGAKLDRGWAPAPGTHRPNAPKR